ncbi:DUF3373 family protein [Sulfurimonas sp. NWX79]|uniref:DUF3373 family protein n=1 Tax=Sulfurimonas sp. NWX79 TaxID=2925412 RepID=UPI003204E85F
MKQNTIKKMFLLLATTSLLQAEITASLEERVSKLEQNSAIWEHLKLGADYRFSYDNIRYKMANGDTKKNDSLLTNRLWLIMDYKPDTHVHFYTKLAFNKVFGQSNVSESIAFDQFDWYGATTNTDNQLRVKEAYIDYQGFNTFGSDIPWNFGVGRRPTSYNKLASLRDDEAASSPLGHIVAAEFDGGHLKFDFSHITSIPGLAVKFALGRGMSSISSSKSSPTPLAKSGENINMYGFNFIPYSTKKLHLELQILKATNLVDITNAGFDNVGNYNPNNYDPTLQVVGDMNMASAMAMYTMESWNKTTLFASYAYTQTDPNANSTMLGSQDKKSGQGYWVGVQTASPLSENGKWGLEFNHGSKYFRPFTYGEDTAVGSKLATRGNAYEAYFTEYIQKGLSVQLRYTYLDYKYSGSNGFFGSQTGTPMDIETIKSQLGSSDLATNVAESAQDIRLYLRYRF